jgi:DNA-binding NarL/FixJ family response regulator
MHGDSVTLDQLPKPDDSTAHVGPRALIVVDRRALAELLSGALEAAGMHVVGTAHSAARAVAMAHSLQPDVVVMEVELAEQDGLAATRRLRQLAQGAAVAVLASHPQPDMVTRMAEAGASAFIPTNCSLTQLIDVLSRLSRTRSDAGPGPMLIWPSMFSGPPILASSPPSDAMGLRLTRREQELLRCLGEAMPLKAIAQNLGITLNTCRSYVKSLHSKLNSGSTLEAVLRAQSLGLLP